MKRGTYVKVTSVNREGVYWDDNSDGTIQVQPKNSFIVHCDPNDVTIVPDSDLSVSAVKFVNTLREQNSWDHRWEHEMVKVGSQEVPGFEATIIEDTSDTWGLI